MTRKYHNPNPQTTPWHREEEPLNHHKTLGRQIKQSNQLSLPRQADCNDRMDINHYSVYFIFLSFGIMGFIVELWNY